MRKRRISPVLNNTKYVFYCFPFSPVWNITATIIHIPTLSPAKLQLQLAQDKPFLILFLPSFLTNNYFRGAGDGEGLSDPEAIFS